jgi:hypothetical protein
MSLRENPENLQGRYFANATLRPVQFRPRLEDSHAAVWRVQGRGGVSDSGLPWGLVPFQNAP